MSVNDYISVIPQVLVWSARRLGKISVIPWPLWVGGLFPLYLGAVYFIFWLRRGTAWPVKCNYPVTEKKGPCRHLVTGEWYKCRHHNRRRTYAFGHTVDPTICRWQRFDRHGRKVDSGKCGIGLFGRKPKRKTLFFYNGFSRPVGHVLSSMHDETRKLVTRLRGMRLQPPTDPTVDQGTRKSVIGVDIAKEVATVIPATRFTLVAFIVALVATGVAVLLPDTPKAMTQWAAILGFTLAWAAISQGVYRGKPNWLNGTCLAALKWWTWTFVPVAVIGLLFGSS